MPWAKVISRNQVHGWLPGIITNYAIGLTAALTDNILLQQNHKISVYYSVENMYLKLNGHLLKILTLLQIVIDSPNENV